MSAACVVLFCELPSKRCKGWSSASGRVVPVACLYCWYWWHTMERRCSWTCMQEQGERYSSGAWESPCGCSWGVQWPALARCVCSVHYFSCIGAITAMDQQAWAWHAEQHKDPSISNAGSRCLLAVACMPMPPPVGHDLTMRPVRGCPGWMRCKRRLCPSQGWQSRIKS